MFTGRSHNTDRSGEHIVIARDRFVDEATRRHLDWRRQSSTCESAYRRWATASTPHDSAIACAAYSSALDCEERAAAQYEAALAHPRAKGANDV